MLGVALGVTVLLAAPSPSDVSRARTPVPREAYVGHDFPSMSTVLNRHLRRLSPPAFAPCAAFSHEELRTLLRTLVGLASPELLKEYPLRDRRSPRHNSVETLDGHWAALDEVAPPGTDASLDAVARDGLCHGAVLSLVHHLEETTREQLLARPGLRLPLLPPQRHEQPPIEAQPAAVGAAGTAHAAAVYGEYESLVSCQQCHSGTVVPKWRNATLPPPLPVDPAVPGRERERSCDYQDDPPCGPCDGLGGPRWGDGSADFTPVNCSIVQLPGAVAMAERVPGRYPPLGRATLVGESRQPLAVQQPKTCVATPNPLWAARRVTTTKTRPSSCPFAPTVRESIRP